MRSWWVAVAAALVVALIAGGGYAVVRSGDPSAQPPIGRASDTPTQHRSTATPTPLVEPPSPPVETPVPPKSPNIRPPEPPSAPLMVPVADYEPTARADRLRLHYTIGVPECYGVVDPETGVTVTETADAVRVLLTRTPPPETDEDTACIDIGLLKAVTIDLESPLGDRALIDARTGRRVPERSVALR